MADDSNDNDVENELNMIKTRESVLPLGVELLSHNAMHTHKHRINCITMKKCTQINQIDSISGNHETMNTLASVFLHSQLQGKIQTYYCSSCW